MIKFWLLIVDDSKEYTDTYSREVSYCWRCGKTVNVYFTEVLSGS